MFEILTKAFVYALEAYAGLGFVVAVPFVWFGVQRLDSEAQGSGVGFRLQIRRGYGNGLKSYRRLVYAHIAPSKPQSVNILHQRPQYFCHAPRLRDTAARPLGRVAVENFRDVAQAAIRKMVL